MTHPFQNVVDQIAARRAKTADRRVTLPRRLVQRGHGRYEVTPEVRAWLTEHRMRPRFDYFVSSEWDEDGEEIAHYELNFAKMAQAFEFKLRWI